MVLVDGLLFMLVGYRDNFINFIKVKLIKPLLNNRVCLNSNWFWPVTDLITMWLTGGSNALSFEYNYLLSLGANPPALANFMS